MVLPLLPIFGSCTPNINKLSNKGENETINVEFVGMMGFDVRDAPPDGDLYEIPNEEFVEMKMVSAIPRFRPIAEPADVHYLRSIVAQ